MIHIQDISKQYGTRVLFDGASAQIGSRSKLALIGPNGAGKSTLIKMILGFESPDNGKITRVSHLSIGYLAQEMPKLSNESILTEVMKIGSRREELLLAKAELENKFVDTSTSDTDPNYQQNLDRYGRVLEELEHLDEYRLESRAKEILSGVGFSEKDFNRSLSEFSGGWLMRVALARVLLMDPDLLLLDEPTNHLDLESLLWLEDFLISFQGAILVVSHDTAFLNRIVQEVLEIDQKKLWSYRGNLDAYALQKEERLKVLKAQFENQQSKIAEMQEFIDRFRAKATKARQAQSRMKQLEKMELIELPQDKAGVRFRFPPAPHSGKEVITFKNGQFKYGEKTIFKNLNWVLPRGSRVAIVGVNGAGKTTLLKLISGQLQLSDGECKLGHMVKIGYYAQHQAESLNMNKTILDELEMTAPDMPVSQVRAIAGAFLFTGDAVEKKCGVLSGGEKARVALAKLLLSPSNFLILDEPTNHLDVESRGVLLDALQDYEGTLCLVSHDRAFVSPLVDIVLEVSQSEVVALLGSYEDYLQKKMTEMKDAKSKLRALDEKGNSKSDQTKPDVLKKAQGPSNNQKQAWVKEKQKIEKEIDQLENRKSAIHGLLADSSTYEDKQKSLKLMEEERGLQSQIDQKMNRWEELALLMEEHQVE